MTDTSKQPEDISDPDNRNRAFEATMRGFNGALHNNDYADAMGWAAACARIAGVTKEENHLSGTRAAYSAIILGAAARFEALALHCGNITLEHHELSRMMYGSAHYLDQIAREGSKGVPAFIAASTLNYACMLFEKIGKGHENPPYDPNTATKHLVEVFALFDPMVEFARGLIRSPENFSLTPDGRLAAAGTAMQNTAGELNWLLGSNWDKALWYTKRSLELVAIDPPADRPGPTEAPRKAMLPRLQPAVDDMVKLIDALKEKNYRDSKRLVKNINTVFEQFLVSRA